MKKRIRLALTLTILLGAACVLAWLAYVTWHSVALIRSIEPARALAASELSPRTGLEAGALLRQSALHYQALDAAVRPLFPLLDRLGRVPPFRAASQARPLFDTASHLLAAGLAVSHGLDPMFSQLSVHAGQEELDLAMLLRSLQNAGPDLTSAEESLSRAETARAGIDLTLLPSALRDRLASPLARLDELLPLAHSALGLLKAAPALAGIDHERVYLVAAQNNDELRATGGFISALGPVRLRAGKIDSLDLVDSFSIDDFSKNYPSPPAPLRRIMLSGYWVPRDANWSPDFPRSAADLADLYTLSTDIPVEGVIAFDPLFIADLTRILGPLQVASNPEPVSGDEVIQWMHQVWSPQAGEQVSADWWNRRKDFIPSLGRALIAAFFDADFERMSAAGKAAYNAVQQGHLLVWFAQEDEQAALAAAGLSGAVDPGQSDYLFLVDSNVGFNKADAHIERSISYSVDLSDPAFPRAMLRAEYTNHAVRGLPCVQEARYGDSYADLTQRCYWDYWRVLAAPGSMLTYLEAQEIPPGPAIYEPNGWPGIVEMNTGPAGTTEFGGMLLLPPASSGGFVLGWDLPATVLAPVPGGYRYTLRLVKQPGLVSLPVSLALTPPAGCELNQNYPAKLTLVTAQTLSIEFNCP